ncbi:MAG: hypothetical protein FJX20_09720 [Alphaproteobacteria bacterium]|nr:hypothetical protein [Alphaproteobacteria bacterium]
MAAPRRTGPSGLRLVAFALAIGGVLIGIVAPVVFVALGAFTMDIVPGVDLVLVLFPVIGIVDWIMAYYFWRKANPPASRDGPVVG